MFKDKMLFWLLFVYVVLQLGTLFLGIGLFLFLYLIAYVIAIVTASIKTARSVSQEQHFKPLLQPVILFLTANLILFLIYIPALIYNPNINWKLKGETEADPMILQVYVPPVFFGTALVFLVLCSLITYLVAKARSKRNLA
jgi:hypothetical protein